MRRNRKGQLDPMVRRFAAVVFAGGLAVSSGSVWGQSGGTMDPDLYGLAGNLLVISAEEFTCGDWDGNCRYYTAGAGFWKTDGLPYKVVAPINLPSGALVTGMRVFYADTSADYNILVSLDRVWQSPTSGGGALGIASFVSDGSPGTDIGYVDISPDLTIEYRIGSIVTGYLYQWYRVVVDMGPVVGIQLRAVGIHWQRQVSAAPGTSTFNDVSTGHWAFQHIEALSASGITSGCGGGSFCPGAHVTRAEMAVFLAKALGLHYAP